MPSWRNTVASCPQAESLTARWQHAIYLVCSEGPAVHDAA